MHVFMVHPCDMLTVHVLTTNEEKQKFFLTLYHTNQTFKKVMKEAFWERKKMLATSIFSFFHNVFKSSFSGLCVDSLKYRYYKLFIKTQTNLKAVPYDKINNTQSRKVFSQGIENIVGKGENAGNQHFLLFQHCFHDSCSLGIVLGEITPSLLHYNIPA